VKKAARRALQRALCARFPDFVEHGMMLVPLYVPSDHVHFTLGERFGGGSRTFAAGELDAIVALIESVGLPLLDRRGSPEALASASDLAVHPNVHMRVDNLRV
jgi:hypothetical protein